MRSLLIFYICLFLLSSCNFFKKKEEAVQEDQGIPIARVYNKYLYAKEIEGIEGISSKEDSVALVERYIEGWILKQLLLLRAEGQVDETDQEIQSKILDCRTTLLIHEFEKEYLEKTLDTSMSEKDLKNYYEANINNFELKQNIIKGFFIKVPKNAPETGKIRALINSNSNESIAELKSYCVRFANQYILQDSLWINFDEIILNTPFMNVQDKADFLEKNHYSELSDDRYLYYLKIKDYKISKQISPFEFVKDRIRNTILSRRKIDLINKLKHTIYQDAKSKKDFEIYREK